MRGIDSTAQQRTTGEHKKANYLLMSPSLISESGEGRQWLVQSSTGLLQYSVRREFDACPNGHCLVRYFLHSSLFNVDSFRSNAVTAKSAPINTSAVAHVSEREVGRRANISMPFIVSSTVVVKLTLKTRKKKLTLLLWTWPHWSLKSNQSMKISL